MDETGKLRKVRKLVIERLRQVALGQPISRPQKPKRKPWIKLGKHASLPYFDVQCEGCGRFLYFQLKKEKGQWSWRPYHPYGKRKVTETKPLVEEIITQRMKSISKSKLEEILDGFTDEGTDETGTQTDPAKR
jgi:hypothetical protein